MPDFKMSFGTVAITEYSRKLISEILDSQRVSQGRYVREFEEAFACLLGVKEAVALSSGTDADTLALAALYDFGLERQDEVIVPALSFVATGNAVLHAGLKPVFVDVDRQTLNIDASKIERAITKKTRVIMPVHLMGKPADMDKIKQIADKHNLYVIEDAAEAHGAEYKGKKIGTIGDMAAFSLYVAHMISTIEGGIVVTDNPEFAEILRSLRAHGRACKCPECVLNTNSAYCPRRFDEKNRDIRFVFERIGYSSKMNEIEAAVGLGNIKIYPEVLAKRRENLLYLIEKFSDFSAYMTTIREEPDEKIGPHAFPIILREDVQWTRDEFVSYLEKNGVETRSLFCSMPTQCKGFQFLGYKSGDFPNAEYMENHGLHIGLHQGIGKKDIDCLLEIINKFLSLK
ncbi:MAG: DegT/DnrJ/EryC1/StrS family aminotransferase [Candidatus Omnitrophota bacterium]